jgi:acetoin utilization deacetylase AcuC-like enzyme
MTLLYTDPIFLKHETGSHPETAERLRAIERRLASDGLFEKAERGDFAPATTDKVAAIHSPAMIERAQAVAGRGGGFLDVDTVVSPASYDVALAAAGAASAAVDAVMTGKSRTALCLVRPPGHHATPTRSMGFCLFNTIALAAHRARTKHEVNRVLIVDWDVHHGNGTQDVFFEDPAVFFLSIHRYGFGFYPGTGSAEEVGRGPGRGTTLNVPIAHGTRPTEFHDAFRRGLERAADANKPELVLISAGFDAHRLDPVGGLGLVVEDFATLTRDVLAIARTHAGGRVVSCLEGGYHWDATAESVAAHLTVLLEKGN